MLELVDIRRLGEGKTRFLDVLGDSLYRDFELTEKDLETTVQKYTARLQEMFGIDISVYSFEELRNNRANNARLGKSLSKKIPKEKREDFSRLWSDLMLIIKPKYLRVSANPLDLIMISDNTCGWTTCHGFGNAYYPANFLYADDPVTLVAYTHNASDHQNGIPRKYWRMLIYVDPVDPVRFFATSEQYPLRVKALKNKVIELLKDLFGFQKLYGVIGHVRLGVTDIGPYLDKIDLYACEPKEIVFSFDWNKVLEKFPELYSYGAMCLCDNCGRPVAEDYFTEVNGEFFCPECFEKIFAHCETCGAIVEKEKASSVDDRYYCDKCLEELDRCERCGAPVREREHIIVEGHFFCQQCAWELAEKCDICGAYYFKEHVRNHGGPYICDDCARYFRECEKCHKNKATINIGGKNLCRHCAVLEGQHCSCCGQRIFPERKYNFDGRLYCHYCYGLIAETHYPLFESLPNPDTIMRRVRL